MELQEAVGKILRKAREARGLSQEVFGAEAGIARTYVSLIELGSSSATLKMLEKACKWHGLEVSAVIAEAEQMIRKDRKTHTTKDDGPSSGGHST
jgi:transcriptional regulator with XRE-family HTH domain